MILSSPTGRACLSTTSKIAGLLALMAPVHALAQDDAEGAAATERSADERVVEREIVVTGSRIDRPGFESPTPLLRVTAEDLNIVSQPNIGAALADLPQFKAGQSPQTSGTNAQAGRFPVDLRGLGADRTLVLLDGRRFASDNDLNTIPSVLVKSVDVVTGGASAAWGSGAVAGVVNVSLDDAFTGVKLGAQAGISRYGDAGQRMLEGAFGLNFAGDRGHFMIGGEYVTHDGLTPKTARPNTGRWVSLPNGDGTFTLTPDVGYANAFIGGIILSGVLQNKGFNPDGSLRELDLGRTVGTNMVGGEAPSDDDRSPLITPQNRYAGLARLSYELTDSTRVIAEMRYSRYFGDYIWFGDHNRGNITIQSDNAFLRPEIQAQLAGAGETSFTMGRYNSDLSYTRIDLERETIQGTLALEGSFADERWRWDAYYSHGEYRNNIDTPGFRLATNFAQAVDAVADPVTGDPICRVALANPSSDCVPLDLFGEGAPSQAAIDYVTGTPSLRSTTKLDTLGASLRGEPFDLWAGPVSIAVGAEARRESIESVNGELDRAGAFATFAFGQLHGKDSVKEAFAEILIPLAQDVPGLHKLELNGAARISDYRNSGSIWSWKVGATNEFVPGVIGRVTRSRDIRSPSLSELYATETISYTSVSDPQTDTTVSVLVNGGGNPDLKPEKADTLTAGLAMAPLDGLTASIDYFDIRIDGVISGIGAQELVTRCYEGSAELCQRVFRDADGMLLRVLSNPVNLAEYKTNGIDAEIAYTMPLGNANDGELTFRAVGTWVDKLTTDDGVTKFDYVRSQGYAFVRGVPKWRVNASVGYSDRQWSGTVRARYISPGYFNITQNSTNNRIPAYTYFDLNLATRVRMNDERELEVYGSVTNLFDKDPPPGSMFSPYYDVIGRYFSLGARIRL